MGTYKQSAQELADVMNNALDESEGDFDLSELKKAFHLVAAEQKMRLTLGESAESDSESNPAPKQVI
jgi:hypothetical protein